MRKIEKSPVWGPDPVVGVAAELADRRGRRGDQTHVVELFVDEEELLVAIIHLLDGGLVSDPFGFGLADDLLGLSPAAMRSVTSSMRTRKRTLSPLFGASSRANGPRIRG